MKGFTLLEFVLVISLLAILAGVAIPRLSTSAASLDAATEKIRSDLVYAQSLAMSRGVVHGVDFVIGNPYVVYQGTPATPVTDPLTRATFSEDLSEYSGAEVISNYRVEFDSLGRPVVGGGGSFVIRSGGLTRTIEIRPETGKVVVP